MLKPGLFQGPVYNIQRSLYKTLLVCVLHAEDEVSSLVLCDQIRIERRPQISYMHAPCRAGSKSCPHFVTHLFSPILVCILIVALSCQALKKFIASSVYDEIRSLVGIVL